MKHTLRAPALAACLGLIALLCGSARADEAALKAAIEARDHRALQSLLQAGERPTPLPAQPDLMRTASHPLALAVANRDLQAAELLLRSGLPAEDLRQVARLIDRQPAMLTLFLNHGLDPNVSTMGLSLVASAVLEGDLATLRTLQAKGAALDRRDVDGNTLLHLAQRADRKKRRAMVEALLALGLPVQAVNQAGNSVLHLALEDADPDTIESLLAAGAAIDTRNAQGLSPLASLWGSSRNRSLQERHPASALSAEEREFAARRQIEGDDSCRSLAPLVAAAGGTVPPGWVALAVQRNSPGCLHRLLALGGSPQLSEHGLPLWLRAVGEPGQPPKLVARQLIAAGARLPAGPLPGMAEFAPYLADPAHRDWWRLAGLTLKTPLQLREGAPPVSVEAWLKREAHKTLAAWKQAPALKPRAVLGPVAPAEWVGVWRQQMGPRDDADDASEWQFSADGRFRAHLKALFLKLKPQGRWSPGPEGLQLQGEGEPPFARQLTPLLWVGDEIWFDDLMGPQHFRRVAKQVTLPPAAPRNAASQCPAAAAQLAQAAPTLKTLMERAPADPQQAARRSQALARLSDAPAFEAACRAEYDQNGRMRSLADCLATMEGPMGVLACMAQLVGDTPSTQP